MRTDGFEAQAACESLILDQRKLSTPPSAHFSDTKYQPIDADTWRVTSTLVWLPDDGGPEHRTEWWICRIDRDSSRLVVRREMP